MKQFLMIVLLCFVCNRVYPQQDYRPMLTLGKKWYISAFSEINTKDAYWMTVEKDTVVYGEKLVWISQTSTDRVHRTEGFLALEKDRQVYTVVDNGEGLDYYLTFDFSLNMGDKVSEGCKRRSGYYCIDVDTIEVGGEFYRRLEIGPDKDNLEIDTDYNGRNVYWVEGIGTNCWLNTLYYTNSSTMVSTHTNTFLACYEGETCLFRFDDFWLPKTENKTDHSGNWANILSQFKEQDYRLFDLQGRQLQKKPTKGIYIQNGKKVLSK